MARILPWATLAAALHLWAWSASGQIIVYDNLAEENWGLGYPTALVTGNNEVGDEIVLAGGAPQTLLGYSLQYYTQALSGDEQMRIRFYRNDGPLVQGAASPGEVLFDSGSLPVAQTSGHHVLTLTDLDVAVPSSFTWAVQFTGVAAGEEVGVAIHGPAAVGSSQIGPSDDFWEVENGSWKLSQLSGEPPPPSSFGAQMTVVPEPGACSLLASLALLGLAVYRRRTRR